MTPIDRYLAEAAPDTVFVFPTEVSASCWADRFLEMQTVGTVAMERFVAWDTFKAESIRSQKQDKKSIPAVVRKLFVAALLTENAELCTSGNAPLFRSLVNPRYAESAASFADWITSLLPPLALYIERIDKTGASRVADDEDADLRLLSMRYRQFLDENALFEPAWEKPPFSATGKQIIIFFPELLADFAEYRALLENAPNVTIVNTPQESGEKRTFFYQNSRAELRHVADDIRDLVEMHGVPYDRIAVSVPDMENYEAYLFREFALRNIPAVKRAGKVLASYPAGSLFLSIAECVSSGFSFAALTKLLLNRHLPWKDEAVISELFDFGIKNNCRTSWVEWNEQEKQDTHIDVWEDAFVVAKTQQEHQAATFYRELKRHATALVHSQSFEEIRNRYFAFRERFFDAANFLPESDLVLSRCVAELMLLIDIGRSFPKVRCSSPFTFFCEYIKDKQYLPKQTSVGVSVFPYRLAASAPFDCHIVVGAVQKDLSVIFSELNFLRQDKRKALGFADTDASESFIRHYTLSSITQSAAFFCAEETFAGYAIPHSALGINERTEEISISALTGETAAADPYAAELAALAKEIRPVVSLFPPVLFSAQKAGFDAWNAAHFMCSAHSADTADAAFRAQLRQRIQTRFAGRDANAGKMRVSATALRDYFTCPLLWLDKHVFGIETVSMEAPLTAANVYGQVCHAILQGFFTGIKDGAVFPEDRGILRATPDFQALLPEYNALLEDCTDRVLDSLAGNSSLTVSPVAARLFRAQRWSLLSRLKTCLTSFLCYFAGFRIMETEKWHEATPRGNKPDSEDYYLLGQIDLVLNNKRETSQRLSTNEDFQPVVIDFKTGEPPKRADCVTLLTDVQLPIYITLYEKNAGVPVDTALFFSINQAAPRVIIGSLVNQATGKTVPAKDIIERDDAPDSRYAVIMDEVNNKVSQYAAALRTAVFADAAKPDWQTCNTCERRFSCRTTYTVARSGFEELAV
jgi:hypothetical protein